MENLKTVLMNVHGYELNQIMVLENIVIGSKSENGIFTNSVACYGNDGKIWVRDYTSEVKILRKMHTHEAVEDILEIASKIDNAKSDSNIGELDSRYLDLLELMSDTSLKEMRIMALSEDSMRKLGNRVNIRLQMADATYARKERVLNQLKNLENEKFAMQA